MFHQNFKLNGLSFNTGKTLLNFIEKNIPGHYPFLSGLFDEKDFITAYTSGSTGKAKKIKIKKKYLYNSARMTIDFFDLPPKSKVLLNLSPEFIAGKMMWVRALTGGWHLDLINPQNNLINKQLKKKKYDFGAMVPLQVYANINHISQIEKLIIGGGAISGELKNNLSGLPNKIFATYGMTETVTHIAVKALNDSAEKFRGLSKNYYRVLKNIKISTDQRNCLIIDAPEITDKQIITNDLVQIIDDKHFEWLGRFDHIVNSGGIKLIPEQIEQKIAKYINTNFFVTGIPDKKLGEKLILIVEGNISVELSGLKKILGKYEIPKVVYSVPSFIRTDSGKINRKKTLDLIKNRQ